MKLSIIIPAYNVEQYVGNCLESIFNQKIGICLLEIIVVNDGSKDRTEEIVKAYASDHPNLVYIHQENQGQSVARNVGLRRATGDYIWYVDSDDATTENSISTIFSYIEKYPNADFLTFDNIYFNFIDGEKHYSKSWVTKNGKTPYGKAYRGYEANKIFKSVVPWYHVFKRDFLISNDLYFTPGLLHEDNELTMRLFFFAQEVRFIPFAHYIYTGMRPGSLTVESRTFNLKSAKDTIRTIEVWKGFGEEYAKTSAQKQFVNKAVNRKYRLLMLHAVREDQQNLHSLYQEHFKQWRKNYKESFRKSISLRNFSWIELVRFVVTLYFPQFYKYTEARTLKSLFLS